MQPARVQMDNEAAVGGELRENGENRWDRFLSLRRFDTMRLGALLLRAPFAREFLDQAS
jgi:hypothetical protein